MATIHGKSHAALKFFRKEPAALAVYWIYLSRTNKDNVAWPSLRGLQHSTGWSINICKKARKWLVDHKALELVENYIRPDWRAIPEGKLKKTLGMDKSEYYRPTGVLEIDGQTYPLLYIPADEKAEDVDEKDASQGKMSQGVDVSSGVTSHGVQHVQGVTELDSLIHLDSTEFQLDTKKEKDNAPAIADAPPTPVEASQAIYADAPQEPVQQPIKATDLIKAWLDASGVIDPAAYKKKPFRDLADAMLARGITPEHVTALVKDLLKEDYYQRSGVKFGKVAEVIVSWLPKYEQRKAAEARRKSNEYVPAENPVPVEEFNAVWGKLLEHFGIEDVQQ